MQIQLNQNNLRKFLETWKYWLISSWSYFIYQDRENRALGLKGKNNKNKKMLIKIAAYSR